MLLRLCRFWISLTRERVISCLVTVVLFATAAVVANDSDNGPLLESDRLIEYHRQYHGIWPPTVDFLPNTTEWTYHMRHRMLRLDSATGNRWDGYIQTMYASLLVPNFTQDGFGICPQCAARHMDWFKELQQTVKEGWNGHLSGERPFKEEHAGATDGPVPAWYLGAPELVSRALHELRPYAEAWSGLSLTPHGAYGLRLYRNTSKLYMHLDKLRTHVISIILHIGSSSTSNGWPLYIEDLRGRTHALYMEPADILFYESSKILHGRPEPFQGEWYTSIFCHYFPTNLRLPVSYARYAVPTHWRHPQPAHNLNEPHLEINDTSLVERSCPNEWCATTTAIPWRHSHNRQQSRMEDSTLTWLDADGVEHPLNLLKDDSGPQSATTNNNDQAEAIDNSQHEPNDEL